MVVNFVGLLLLCQGFVHLLLNGQVFFVGLMLIGQDVCRFVVDGSGCSLLTKS